MSGVGLGTITFHSLLLVSVFVVSQIEYIGSSSLAVLGDNADVRMNEYSSFIPESRFVPLRAPLSAATRSSG